jgi:hypothetical protein
MATLRMERLPLRSAVCPECGHELYPLYSALAEHPQWECRSQHCRVGVTDAADAPAHVCGCEGALHHQPMSPIMPE